MSIGSDLARVVAAKRDIITEIKAKGQDVPDGTKLDALAAKVAAIEMGNPYPITEFTGIAQGNIAAGTQVACAKRQWLNGVASLSTNPPGEVFDISYSPDGLYMAIVHTNSPFVSIYKRNGEAYTKLANPSVLPSTAPRGGCLFARWGLFGGCRIEYAIYGDLQTQRRYIHKVG